ncbi:type II toxin-antitoxin system antitoxin SocA domain-containing protein [Solibacillus sp. FSL W8-0372]|uniref:Panacea domain-containing protein n=1 Tax=Solibacillus sp. FSL W8-0372 TaxID=2921713 RepID=UPI0030CFEA8A
MAGMRDLANHIIAVANQNDLPVTNLQVQKVMFFSLGMHIRQTGAIDNLVRRTYDVPFEKWQYGPVVESIYYRLNHMKDKDVTSVEEGRYSPEYAHLDGLIKTLLDINVFDLVKLSHDLPSWAKYEQDILNRNYVEPYTLKEIEEDFLNG